MYLDVFDRNPYGTNCWLVGAEMEVELVNDGPFTIWLEAGSG